MTGDRLDDVARWAREYEGGSESIPPFVSVRAAIRARRRRVLLRRAAYALAASIVLVAGGVVVARQRGGDAHITVSREDARSVIAAELRELDAALDEIRTALATSPDDELLQRRQNQLAAQRSGIELDAAQLLRRTTFTTNE